MSGLAPSKEKLLRLAHVARRYYLEDWKQIDIARELGVPVSTTALNIQILERAGLVSCEMQPGARGAMKMCVRGIDRVHISLSPTPRGERRVWECEMPVGCYALVGGVQPTCGMASRNCKMNADDDPRSFYRPNHFEADLLWMRAGFVEYHFPPADVPLNRVDFLELSFEACSETLGHNNRWPSSIYVEINGWRLGVWHCEGDFGGRRGQWNPPWWDATSTQFGQLKNLARGPAPVNKNRTRKDAKIKTRSERRFGDAVLDRTLKNDEARYRR